MVFGPARSRPSSCSLFLSGQLLHVVSSYRYLGVVLTPSLRWDAHITHLISRGDRLFAQSTSWATPKASLHLLHISCSPRTCSPMPPSEPSSFVIAREVSRSWTLHNDAGDVISLDGHRARRPLRYSVNLRFPTVSACLHSAGSTRSLQELTCHSPPQS